MGVAQLRSMRHGKKSAGVAVNWGLFIWVNRSFVGCSIGAFYKCTIPNSQLSIDVINHFSVSMSSTCHLCICRDTKQSTNARTSGWSNANELCLGSRNAWTRTPMNSKFRWQLKRTARAARACAQLRSVIMSMPHATCCRCRAVLLWKGNSSYTQLPPHVEYRIGRHIFGKNAH